MNTKGARNQALQSVAEACARVAVAAGATPRTAANCLLPHGARFESHRKKLRKQLEESQRQAKRPNNTLIKRYNASINQLNGVMGTECSPINPSARYRDMGDTQRELCAQAALDCARLLSTCSRLLPDEVFDLAEEHRQILQKIEKADRTLLDALDRLDEAHAVLQALTAHRYLENSALMSSRSKRRARDKFLLAINQGDSVIDEILAAVACHVSSCDALTRNAVQVALLLGADVNVVAQAADCVAPVSYLRRSKSIPADVTLDVGPAINDVQRCVGALQSSRQYQNRLREHVAGWRLNATTVRHTVEARLK